MTPIERETARIRRELLARERRTQRELIRVYGETLRRVNRQLEDLQAVIAQARARGESTGVLLVRQARFERFIEQAGQELARYILHAEPTITQLQRDHAQRAIGDTYDLTRRAMGSAPPNVGFEFRPPPADVVVRLIGNASDGTPLGDLLREAAGANLKQARDELLVGVTMGKSPRDIARAFHKASGQTLTRSLLIARTESLRAYRQATLETLNANDRIVQGWYWQASFDPRTCPACWAMSGTQHTNDEMLASHPGCRCAMVPYTKSWAELGFRDIPDTRPPVRQGTDVFASQPAATQRQVLGPGKYDAYTQGRVTLTDLVAHTHSERWGPGLRTASLRELVTA